MMHNLLPPQTAVFVMGVISANLTNARIINRLPVQIFPHFVLIVYIFKQIYVGYVLDTDSEMLEDSQAP